MKNRIKKFTAITAALALAVAVSAGAYLGLGPQTTQANEVPAVSVNHFPGNDEGAADVRDSQASTWLCGSHQGPQKITLGDDADTVKMCTDAEPGETVTINYSQYYDSKHVIYGRLVPTFVQQNGAAITHVDPRRDARNYHYPHAFQITMTAPDGSGDREFLHVDHVSCESSCDEQFVLSYKLKAPPAMNPDKYFNVRYRGAVGDLDGADWSEDYQAVYVQPEIVASYCEQDSDGNWQPVARNYEIEKQRQQYVYRNVCSNAANGEVLTIKETGRRHHNALGRIWNVIEDSDDLAYVAQGATVHGGARWIEYTVSSGTSWEYRPVANPGIWNSTRQINHRWFLQHTFLIKNHEVGRTNLYITEPATVFEPCVNGQGGSYDYEANQGKRAYTGNQFKTTDVRQWSSLGIRLCVEHAPYASTFSIKAKSPRNHWANGNTWNANPKPFSVHFPAGTFQGEGPWHGNVDDVQTGELAALYGVPGYAGCQERWFTQLVYQVNGHEMSTLNLYVTHNDPPCQ